jgi:hypothetical protein
MQPFDKGGKMSSNALLFGWNRPVPGREKISAEHFGEFVQYLGSLQQKGTIQSFDVVFLDPHGGDLNGFFLIRGDSNQLDGVMSSSEWVTHMTRALIHLDGSGAIRGVAGEMIRQRMDLWTGMLPPA